SERVFPHSRNKPTAHSDCKLCCGKHQTSRGCKVRTVAECPTPFDRAIITSDGNYSASAEFCHSRKTRKPGRPHSHTAQGRGWISACRDRRTSSECRDTMRPRCCIGVFRPGRNKSRSFSI